MFAPVMIKIAPMRNFARKVVETRANAMEVTPGSNFDPELRWRADVEESKTPPRQQRRVRHEFAVRGAATAAGARGGRILSPQSARRMLAAVGTMPQARRVAKSACFLAKSGGRSRN